MPTCSTAACWPVACGRAAACWRCFGWTTAATLLLLACVLGIPAVSRLFAFEQPTPWMLLAAVGLALLGLLWFEGVKWVLGRKGEEGGVSRVGVTHF